MSLLLSIKLDEKLFKKNQLYKKSNDIEENLDECRICLENCGILLSVCQCDGTCKFVHKECIKTWINRFHKENSKHNVCQICNSNYNFELINESETTFVIQDKFIIICLCSAFLMFFLIVYLVIN